MGYTTDFEGQIQVNPPLSSEEVEFLKKFSDTRRMDCEQGPYYVDRGGFAGQDDSDKLIKDYNKPPSGQPGLWCKWEPTDNGTYIRWNEMEKFYDSVEWMQYLIDHFIGASPLAKGELPFLEGHELSGEIFAQGEDPGDTWKLVVANGIASMVNGHIVYD